jgi:hypothetical protein
VSYSAEISRSSPACVILMIDQSASMEDPIGGDSPGRKADVVADAINRLLTELSVKCAKEDGVRDYFHVGVIGYGHTTVGPAFGGVLAGRELVPLSQVADNPARIEERVKKVPDGAGGLVESTVRFPVWLDPKANGGTPMVRALNHVAGLISGWLAEHPGGFPPIVLNLSDGESTDGDLVAAAASVTGQASADGGVLLFNLHVSAAGGTPAEFLSTDVSLPDQHARSLFAASSVLPPSMLAYAASQGKAVNEETRGFVYNADIAGVVQFLEIGTRATELR